MFLAIASPTDPAADSHGLIASREGGYSASMKRKADEAEAGGRFELVATVEGDPL
jgi:hypothetical protein